EQGDEHVRAGDLVTAGRLDVEDRALDDALEPTGRRRIGGAVGDKRPELIVEILLDAGAQLVTADAAGGHHLRRMLVVDQRDQKMFEGRILVPATAGLPQGIVEGLFEFASETGHGLLRLRARRRPGFINNVIRTRPPIKGATHTFADLWLTSLEELVRGGAV